MNQRLASGSFLGDRPVSESAHLPWATVAQKITGPGNTWLCRAGRRQIEPPPEWLHRRDRLRTSWDCLGMVKRKESKPALQSENEITILTVPWLTPLSSLVPLTLDVFHY